MVVHCDAPPTGRSFAGTVGRIQRVGGSIQFDRLVKEAIAGSSLYLNREMVPSIYHLARHACTHPLVVSVVVDVPVMIAEMAALRSPDHFNAVHVHGDVEFQGLCDGNICHIEIGVVCEVVERR